jgi:hypothetical protein
MRHYRDKHFSLFVKSNGDDEEEKFFSRLSPEVRASGTPPSRCSPEAAIKQTNRSLAECLLVDFRGAKIDDLRQLDVGPGKVTEGEGSEQLNS